MVSYPLSLGFMATEGVNLVAVLQQVRKGFAPDDTAGPCKNDLGHSLFQKMSRWGIALTNFPPHSRM